MIIYVFEEKYGFQRLETLGMLHGGFRFKKGAESVALSTVWGTPSPYESSLPFREAIEKDKGKKVFVVLRAAKPLNDSSYTAGVKIISRLTLFGEEFKFGVTAELMEDLRASLAGKVRIAAVFPAAPLLYYFLSSHVIASAALKEGPVGAIDVGFRHTVYVLLTGEKVKFYVSNYGVYDAVDRMAVGSGVSFEKAKKMLFTGQPDYYQEIRTALFSAISGEASFLNAAKTLFLSGVSMIPPAGESFRNPLTYKMTPGAKALSPYILFSMVLQEMGFLQVLSAKGGGGAEGENEYALLLAAWAVVKSKVFKKKKKTRG